LNDFCLLELGVFAIRSSQSIPLLADFGLAIRCDEFEGKMGYSLSLEILRKDIIF